MRYRTRPADELRDELATLAEMGFRELFVKDMSFGAHKRHADETLALLAERHFSWHTYARLEDLPPAVLARMAETGAHLVQVGLEHVVPEILGPMGKPYGVRDIEEFFAASRDARIDVGLHLVLGLPGETPATLAALEDFLAREADPAYVSINLYAPRKGARLAQAEGGGDDPHDSTRGSDSGALPRDVLRRARDRMYRRFYARPARVRRLAGQMRLPEMWHGVRRVFAG
ncbi:MAG: radical SAM protein [Deltaproteobacteria bacterium]|nr:radical SAM protein [Deltaproteobacteria bacterium]